MNAPPDNEPTDNEIVHRWQGGQSMRGIARELGISRWRVERTIGPTRNHLRSRTRSRTIRRSGSGSNFTWRHSRSR